jgi:hypothetical protein
MTRIYDLPPFLDGIVDRNTYVRWLRRKAAGHLKRDRNRGNIIADGASYRLGIHEAVLRSNGNDEYTGRGLRWDLISQYDNDKAAADRRRYKREFYNLPTVDHVGDGLAEADFAICSWQVNDAKHDQTLDEFVEMCRSIVSFNDKSADEHNDARERPSSSDLNRKSIAAAP